VTRGRPVNRAPALLLALVLLAGAAVAAETGALKAGAFSPPRQAPDFSLAGSDGKELKLSRYRGKVVLLGFGFTSCPNVCPTTLALLAQVRRQLGRDAGEVQVVYVTVDPERDDAARLRAYLAAFDPTFVGGTGSPERLAAVRKDYGVVARKVPGAGGDYSMDHSSFVVLIDRDGKLRALMPYGHTPDDYVHDIRILAPR
jgi:protein SCO1